MSPREEGILMTVRNLLNEAQHQLYTREYDAARTSAERALSVAETQQHKPSIAAAYYGLASVIWAVKGDDHQAIMYANMAVQNTRQDTTTDLLARTLVARIKSARGNHEAAILLNEDLLRYYWEQQQLNGVADILRSLGEVYMNMEHYAQAKERLIESLKLYLHDVDEPLNQAGVLLSLGSLAYQTQDPAEARYYWGEARNLAEAKGFRHVIEAVDQALEMLNENG